MASYDEENWSSATGGSGIYLSSKQLFSNRFGFVRIRFSPRRHGTRSSASMLSSYYGGGTATWDLNGPSSPSVMATVISNDPCSAPERSAIYSMPAMIPLVRVCRGKSAIDNHTQKIHVQSITQVSIILHGSTIVATFTEEELIHIFSLLDCSLLG